APRTRRVSAAGGDVLGILSIECQGRFLDHHSLDARISVVARCRRPDHCDVGPRHHWLPDEARGCALAVGIRRRVTGLQVRRAGILDRAVDEALEFDHHPQLAPRFARVGDARQYLVEGTEVVDAGPRLYFVPGAPPDDAGDAGFFT